MHTIVARFSITYLNTKFAHASDLTGPSSGNTLIVVVCNSYLTISLCIAYIEKLIEISACGANIYGEQKYYTVTWSSACMCWGVHGTENTPTLPYARDQNTVK